MSSLPTLPQRSWLERASLVIECALVLVGLATVAGWVFRLDEVLRPIGYTTLKMNAAVAVVILGGVLFALEFGRRRFAVLALIPAGVGAASLIERLFESDLHFNELLARDYFPANVGRPGQMPAMVALCLLVCGLVLGWHALKRDTRLRTLVTAITGSLVAAIGLSTLAGFGARFPAIYNWGSSEATSPVSAVALLLAGAGFISLAWRAHLKAESEPPPWSPLPVIIGCLTLTLSLWVGLRERENAYVGVNNVTAMDRLVTNVQAEVDRQLAQVERIANHTTAHRDAWELEVRTLWPYASSSGCRVIEYLEHDTHALWFYNRE
jgi:hypothetical protein